MRRGSVKRGRSGIELIGVLVFLAARTIPVLWVLAAFTGGIVLGGGLGELLAYLRHRGW